MQFPMYETKRTLDNLGTDELSKLSSTLVLLELEFAITFQRRTGDMSSPGECPQDRSLGESNL